ncbi:MAG: S49 family peptidase [Isosphaeraceae bacterium]|nr:S49 family peptidase [Isosphaeraceae bacterium]
MAQRWPRYTWDPNARQYRAESGRFVSRKDVKAALSAVIDATVDDVRRVSEQLQRGKIEIADWQLEMERSLKTIHTAATAIATGGWIQAMPVDWAECGRRLKDEYGHLRDFAVELENGLPPDGRFLARAVSYARAAHGTYEVIGRRLALGGGAVWAKRTRHALHSCERCIEYEDRGWVPASTLPAPSTECECGSNCQCTAEYSWSIDHPEGSAVKTRGVRGKAWGWVASQAWAIERSSLKTILSIAERTNADPAAVAAQLGRELDNTRCVTVRDGVATIPVRGPISRYAGIMSELSGATSIDDLAVDLRTAAEDPSVRAIILEIDSPGGQANGVGELAGQIRDASERKPVIAYVGGYACSAAYWLASACGEIVTAETGVLGSIGCVLAVSTGDDDEVEFVSSQSPNKRPDPETKAGRAEIQAHVDALAQIFIDSVAANRDMEPENVVERFGRGGLKIGKAAVDAGMADRIGTYEGLHKELSESPSGGRAVSFFSARGAAATATTGPKPMKLNMKATLARWLAAGKPETIEASEADQHEDVDTFLAAIGTGQKPPKVDLPSAVDVKAIEAKAQRDALVMAYSHQAKTWAQAQVKAGRIDPANVEALAVMYVSHAVDDAVNPLKVPTASGDQVVSRLETFTTGVEARPAKGAVQTQEFVPSDAATVQQQLKAGGFKLFDNGATTPDEAKRAESLSRVEQMLQGSEIGQMALREADAK